MGKLKLYNLESEYLNDKSTHDDSTVSYVLETQKSEFRENGGYIKAIYNISSSTQGSISLINGDFYDKILDMWIDGENVEVQTSASFSSVGLHRVTFLMKKVKTCRQMFCNILSLVSCDLSHFDTSHVTDMYALFSNNVYLKEIDLRNLNTSLVSDMSSMFNLCSNLTSLDLSSFDTSRVFHMDTMFSSCQSLTSLDVSNFNTHWVTDMNLMFNGCEKLTSLDVSNFDTSKVTDMSDMFYGCKGLTSLDLSNFNTSKVTDMSGMFSGCTAIASVDLSNFNTSKVTDMNGMFYNCKSLTLVTFGSQADVSKVTSYGYMFNSITTTGTLYYPSAYADSWNYLLVTNQSSTNFPSTWTAVAI